MEFKNILFLLLEIFFFFRNSDVLALGSEGIIGGVESADGEHPYLVSVQIYGIHLCGGGIIARAHVLTAAHCLINSMNNNFIEHPVQVVGGINDLNSQSPSRQTCDVHKILVPNSFFRDFNRKNTSDIAVLKLKQNFDFFNNPKLGYLLIPSIGTHDYVGATAVLAGFGLSENNVMYDLDSHQAVSIGITNDKSHFIKAKVMSQADCSIRKGYTVPYSRLCASITGHRFGQTRGACDGDSGGPLVMNNKFVIGVMSIAADNCDEGASPGTYTRVTSFLNFIIEASTDTPNPGIRQIIIG